MSGSASGIEVVERRTDAEADGGRRGSRPRVSGLSATTLIIVAATVLALYLRLYQLTRPGMLLGIHQYDDGVYLGAAIRLTDGVVPYRDFAFVQPPGIVLLLAPIGLLAKLIGAAHAMAVARVLTACAGAAAVPLSGRLVRHRGPVAAALSCGILAVHPDSIYGVSTLLLEHWLALFCLLGALALFEGDEITTGRTRLIVGGVAVGVALAIKAFAIFAVVGLLVACLVGASRRRAVRYVAGMIAGFVIPVLPFLAMSPTGFFDGVIVAQYGRRDVTHVATSSRLGSLFGTSSFRLVPQPPNLVVLCLVIGIPACAIVASLIMSRRPPGLDLFALTTAVLAVLGFLIPRDYYAHYATVFGPFLALALGLSTSRLLALARSSRAAGPAGGQRLLGGAVALAILAVVAVMATRDLRHESRWRVGLPSAAIDRAIPAGACVLTDKASFTVMADRFVSRVPGCSQMVDSLGTDLSLGAADNGLTGAGRHPAVERAWIAAFSHAQYVWLNCGPPAAPKCESTTNRRIPWTRPIRRYFFDHFRRVPVRGWRIYVRDGPASARPGTGAT